MRIKYNPSTILRLAGYSYILVRLVDQPAGNIKHDCVIRKTRCMAKIFNIVLAHHWLNHEHDQNKRWPLGWLVNDIIHARRYDKVIGPSPAVYRSNSFDRWFVAL